MIVDDSKLMRRSVMKILKGQYDILEAENGKDALKKLTENTDIRVVCCDLSMPVMDGFGFLEQVRASEDPHLKEMPVIIVTGNEDSEEARKEVLERGADDFVTKPFDSATLTARIKTHLRLEATTRDLEKKATELEEKAATDPVTGLGTQAFFERAGAQLISYASRHEREFIVMQISIDDFQNLFMKIGKNGAVAVLKKVGEIFAKNTRKEDAPSRLTLNTFAAILYTPSLDGAVKMAERVRQSVESIKITLGGQTYSVTASFGLCQYRVDEQTQVKDLLEASGKYLKQAQQQGGNRVGYDQAALGKSFMGLEQALTMLSNGNADEVEPHLDALMHRVLPLIEMFEEKKNVGLKGLIAYLKTWKP